MCQHIATPCALQIILNHTAALVLSNCYFAFINLSILGHCVHLLNQPNAQYHLHINRDTTLTCFSKKYYRGADKSLAQPWKETSYSNEDLQHYTRTLWHTNIPWYLKEAYVPKLKPATNGEIIFTNTVFENVISSFVARFNLRQMCWYIITKTCQSSVSTLYIFDIVHLVGLINEYIDLKRT